jgi:hypothetical protein
MTARAMTGLVNDLKGVQVLVLAAMLLGACAAKSRRMLRTGSLGARPGPGARAELFQLPLRRPAATFACVVECALAMALMVTAPAAARNGTGAMDGAAADGARIAATAFFLAAMCALIEVRGRRPDAGCGCFGDLSTRPVSTRSIARAALLAVAALASIGGPPLHLPPPGPGAALLAAILSAEFLVIALLSPEVGEALVRLGYSEPCELRTIPARCTLAALHRSSHWRRQSSVITSDVPADMWRELCWRYVAYPGRLDGADAYVVFAVQVKQRRPVIQSAVVPRETVTAPPREAVTAVAMAPAAQAESANLTPGGEPLSAMPISKAV